MGFKVGQKVVCVDPSNSSLKTGQQYTIREIRTGFRVDSEPTRICVVECCPNYGFRPSRFKAAEPYVEPSGYTEELME